jgi:hypothetical protein
MTSETRTISLSIQRDWREVYAFAAAPENFRHWASGLGSLRREAGQWIADTPDGPLRVRFTPPNDFGILDHHVIPASGDEIYIALRVIANGAGSEIVFTLFRQPGMSDERFAADADWVRRDLETLKRLLEG